MSDIVWEPKRVRDPFTQRAIEVPHSSGSNCECCGEPAYIRYFRRDPFRIINGCGNPWSDCEGKALRMLNIEKCVWCGDAGCEKRECVLELRAPAKQS